MKPGGKTFLLAVDGSSQSLEAVRYTSRLLSPKGIQMVLFHVLSTIPDFFYDLGEQPRHPDTILNIQGWQTALRDAMDRFVGDARRLLVETGRPEGSVSVLTREKEVGIARDIINEAGRGYAGVALGRTGLSKFKEFIVGSVANKLIEALDQATLCVVGGRPSVTKVLIALDESENALRAVDYAAGCFNLSAVQVTLFHAVRGFDVFGRTYGNLVNAAQEKEWIETGKRGMESVFEEAGKRLRFGGLLPDGLNTRIVTGVSSRAGAIVEEARDGEYGTIVVGRRGLSKVREFFIGRVGMKVLQMAKDRAVWVVG